MNRINQFFKKPYIYLIIILFGVLLKFYGLENRFFWLDEIYTIYHTSGIPTDHFLTQVPENEIVNINYWNDLVNLNNGKHAIRSQLKGLSQMPQLTPLHYAFLVFWHRIIGAEHMDYRLFTILIFILTLPFLFLLARLLFKSQLSGLIATSLYAVSPFIHIYAQEARYYILWAFFMVLIHYLLIQALNKNKIKWWVLYSLTAILTLYTSALSGIIIFGHLLYVWVFYKKLRLNYSISLVCIALIYSPWFFAIINNREEIFYSLGWQSGGLSAWKILMGPWLGMAHIFSYTESFWGYFQLTFGNNYTGEMRLAIIINALLIIFIVTSIVFLFIKIPKKTAWFLILIVLPGILFFNILDLSGNRFTSFSWRYHIMNFIGIILIVAVFLEKKITSGKILFSLFFLGIVILSIISTVKISNDNCWSAFNSCDEKIMAAEIFSNADKPLIITECSTGLGIMGFWETVAECSSENIDILFITDPENIAKLLIDNEYSDIYIYQASALLTNNLIKQYKEGQPANKLHRIIYVQGYIDALLSGEESVDIEEYVIDEPDDMPVVEITFKVIPKFLPPSSTIYITGNHNAIGNWTPDVVPLEENPDGSWTGTFIIEKFKLLEYKITRGDWENEFADKSGRGMPNLTLKVQNDTTVSVIVENWKDLIE